jgi:hypothetical protein
MPQNLASESWTALCRRVARGQGPVAWRWAVARNHSGNWGLASLVVSLGDDVQPFCHRYASVILAVEELSPRTAASRLRKGMVSAKDRVPKGVVFPVPQQITPEWIYSCDEYGFVREGWPCLTISTSATEGGVGSLDLQQPLQSPGQPYFPSFAAALAEKVFGIEPAKLQGGQAAQVLVRIPDRRARIATVDVHEDTLHVGVGGCESAELDGFVLRAAWRQEPASTEWKREDHSLAEPKTVVLETDGVPAELAVVLVDSDGMEIDRRAWNERFGRPAEDPGSLDALVARWIGEGEHGQLEYKQTLKEPKTRTSFAETVAAFANGIGGTVLVGVDDQGQPVGYSAPKARDQVTNIVADLVEESPTIDVQEVEIDGCPLVVVMVAASGPYRKPHQVKGRVMVRALGTTRQATPAQLRQLCAT